MSVLIMKFVYILHGSLRHVDELIILEGRGRLSGVHLAFRNPNLTIFVT